MHRASLRGRRPAGNLARGSFALQVITGIRPGRVDISLASWETLCAGGPRNPGTTSGPRVAPV